MKQLKLIKEYNQFNQKVAEKLKQKVQFDPKIYGLKFSSGSVQPPMKTDQIYLRATGLLRRLTQRPMGIKKLQLVYSKLKRRGVKPPTRAKASYCALKIIISELVKKQYLGHSKFGYYTLKKGKSLLLESL